MTTPAMLLDIVGQTRKSETERLLNLNARIIDLNHKGSSFALQDEVTEVTTTLPHSLRLVGISQ